MLTTRYKPLINQAITPLARGVARLGITPSAITLSCVFLAAAACFFLLWTRQIGWFCLLILIVGSLDALDGAVARATRQTTKFGSYLDAVCDRYVEVMVASSVAWITGYWIEILLVITGSLLVSYAKARAAMEVSVSNQEWPDWMERTERDVLFIAGLAAGTYLPYRPLGRDLFWWMLAVLVVLIHLTVIQRIGRAKRLIQERSDVGVFH